MVCGVWCVVMDMTEEMIENGEWGVVCREYINGLQEVSIIDVDDGSSVCLFVFSIVGAAFMYNAQITRELASEYISFLPFPTSLILFLWFGFSFLT